jgi:hypothetical protein
MADEPIAVPDSVRQHYQSCDQCRHRFAEISSDAQSVREWMAARPIPVDTAAALVRFQTRARDVREGLKPRRYRVPYMPGARARSARIGLAAAAASLALAGALAFTPAGSLAQDVITIFQPSQVVPVVVTANDLQTLQQLTHYGTISGPANTPAQDASGPEAASAQTGMTVLVPSSLPSDVNSKVRYAVLPSESAIFTFSAAKARAASAASGETLPAMPAGMDGSSLELVTGEAVVATYGAGSGDVPSLVIGQMRRPTLTARGVSVQELEDYLLSVPGISPQLAAQIRAIGDPTTALPIPVPVNLAYSHSVLVQGVQGLAVGDSTGVGSGVVWQKDGIIYGVAGPLSEAEVLSIANQLK